MIDVKAKDFNFNIVWYQGDNVIVVVFFFFGGGGEERTNGLMKSSI